MNCASTCRMRAGAGGRFGYMFDELFSEPPPFSVQYGGSTY